MKKCLALIIMVYIIGISSYAVELPSEISVVISSLKVYTAYDNDSQLREALISDLNSLWTDQIKFILEQLSLPKISSYDFEMFGTDYVSYYESEISRTSFEGFNAKSVEIRDIVIEIADLNTHNKKAWLAGIKSEMEKTRRYIPEIAEGIAYDSFFGKDIWVEWDCKSFYNSSTGEFEGCGGEGDTCSCGVLIGIKRASAF